METQKKYKISIDFDGTLEYDHIQELAQKLIEKGHDVHIVTTRYEDYRKYKWNAPSDIHDYLYEVADKLKIDVHFTNMEYKAGYLEANDFNYLIDDNPSEGKLLNKCKFILVDRIDKIKELL